MRVTSRFAVRPHVEGNDPFGAPHDRPSRSGGRDALAPLWRPAPQAAVRPVIHVTEPSARRTHLRGMPSPSPFVALPAPMAPDAALDALYAAFSDYARPDHDFCEDCYDEAARELILRPEPLRTKPTAHFNQIFGEHIECSVGAVGFFHFFPRILETEFFVGAAFPDLTGLALACGLETLDAAHAAAIRDVASTAAHGYFDRRDCAPLRVDENDGPWRYYDKGEGGVRLLRLLMALRVEPAVLFGTFLRRDDEIAWFTIAEAFYYDAWLRETYQRSPPPFCDTINRIAWRDFFEVITPQRLEAGLAFFEEKGRRSRHRARVREQYDRFLERTLSDDREALVEALAALVVPGA